MRSMRVIEGGQAMAYLSRMCQGKSSAADVRRELASGGNEDIHLVFKDVDLSTLRNRGTERLDFRELDFGPRCYVDFSGVDFGDGDVSFSHAYIKQGLNLRGARFGTGSVSFEGAHLQNLDFTDARFEGTSTLSFRGATFHGYSRLDFELLDVGCLEFSTLSEPDHPSQKVSLFEGTLFSLSAKKCSVEEVLFVEAIFNVQHIKFDFGGFIHLAKVRFSRCAWKYCLVEIKGPVLRGENAEMALSSQDLSQANGFSLKGLALPEGGKARFAHTVFPNNGLTEFHFEDMGPGHLDFHGTSFGNGAHFSQGRDSKCEINVDFRGATFNGPLDISGIRFGPVPDFTGTEFRKHLSLHGVQYRYDRFARIWSPDPDPQNAAYFQRLKELAEDNRDQQLALACHADEMRAKRWQRPGLLAKFPDMLDLLYAAASNYGQSIFRPVCLLVVSWLLFAGLYECLSSQLPETEGIFSAILHFMPFAIAMSFPFLPASIALRKHEFIALFGDPAEVDLSSVYLWMGAQGIVSIVALFLIGLGLRNRFRI